MLKRLQHRWNHFLSDKKFSEILKGSIWALAARVISTFFALCASIIVARLYGAEVVGTLAIINSFFLLVTIFTVLGTDTYILRLIPEHLARYSPSSAFLVYRKIQYLVTGVSLFTGVATYLGADLIAERIFTKPHLSYLLSISALFIVFSTLMNLNTQAVLGVRLIRAFVILQIVPSVAKLLILVVLTFFSINPNNPIYAQLVSYLVVAVVGVLIMQVSFKKKMAANDIVCNMSAKRILSVSLPMLMTTTMTFLIGQTGVFVLGVFRPEVEVGYYDIAVKMALLSTFVLNAVNSMVAPKISELYHSDNLDELFYVAQKSTRLIFWTTAPILAGLFFFGKSILHFLFGVEFLASYGAMSFLIIGQLVNSISGSAGIFLNMTNNHHAIRNIMIISAFGNLLLSFLFIPRFGVLGAAISTMLCSFSWNIGSLCYIKAKFGKTTGYFPGFN